MDIASTAPGALMADSFQFVPFFYRTNHFLARLPPGRTITLAVPAESWRDIHCAGGSRRSEA